ncbi:MAG: LD-carboxypeptidase, partial [Myxococcales bacterium]|nr:LD-carboxypeptidase [Myxococcales bacterium]
MSELLAPPALRDGDTIAVVAPAGPVPEERLGPGLRCLEKRYKLLVAPDVCRTDKFLAGSDERRAEEFNTALQNSDVRAIWAARGGYGCSRIVDNLDAAAFMADPVPIVGFSDVTALLCWAAQLGVRSIHGPVLTQLGELGDEDVSFVIEMLAGKGAGALLPCDGSTTPCEGPLLGGNLALLAHLCGTRWAPNF